MDDSRLSALGQFTPERKLTPGYGDSYLFMVGRDDVHGVLKYLISRETMALKLSMFGYDDDELNEIIMGLFKNNNVRVQVSLDRSQAGGVHERKIIALDQQLDPLNFLNSFVIMQSATHQILHTKGGILVAQGVAFEGSTNWSNSGEGTGINLTGKAPTGYKAQSNTLLVSVNPTFVARFSENIDKEHQIGITQANKLKEKAHVQNQQTN